MANEFKVKKGLIVIGSGSNILDIQGSQGQLFSVTDSLSGSLFSVNDISGLPILKVFSDDSVRLGTFNNEAIIVSGNTSKITGSLFGISTNSLTASFVSHLNQNVQITGSVNITGSLSFGSGSLQPNASNEVLVIDNATGKVGTKTTPSPITIFSNQSGTVTPTATSGIVVYEFTGAGGLVLPTAIGNTSIFMVKNRHTSNISVTFTAGQNADGTTSITLVPYQSLQFISNNSNYNIY